jgi:aryl-alcohol dehydrogenase-like predicted oxidoreductase
VRYRRLGRTGLEVSEIGFGAWGIGQDDWIGAKDDESLRALHRAIELGVNFIDTALMYGDGHSEQLVGQAIRDHDEVVYVATKVPVKEGFPPAPPGVPADRLFPADHIRASVETSLRNLRVDTIDVLQLHAWQDDWIGQGDWLEAIDELRQQGKIRFFGISINDHEAANGVRLVESGLVDTVQAIYNVFDQSPEDALLPACEERDVGVVARVPLDEGGLTGSIQPDTEFDPDDFRHGYFSGDRRREVHQRVQRIVDDLEIDASAIAEVALRYILSNDGVSTVIPGMRSLRNVERNTAVSDGSGLPAAQVERLKSHRWVRNFYE